MKGAKTLRNTVAHLSPCRSARGYARHSVGCLGAALCDGILASGSIATREPAHDSYGVELMPNKIPTPCGHRGCRALTTSRWCPEHQKEGKARRSADTRPRPSSCSRGYDRRWQKARAVFLRHNPLCEACRKRGRYTPATVVDHVIPHRGDTELFWLAGNWSALCASCHSRKTSRGQ